MSEKQNFKRKRLFVDTKVQGALVRQLVIHWALACGLIFLYLFTVQAFSNGFALSFQENLSAMGQQFGILGFVLVVVSPVFIYDAVKLSNRFVGPMISFRRALSDLASGNSTRDLHFRRGDFWQDLTGDFNKIRAELETLRKQTEREVEASPAVSEEETVAV